MVGQTCHPRFVSPELDRFMVNTDLEFESVIQAGGQSSGPDLQGDFAPSQSSPEPESGPAAKSSAKSSSSSAYRRCELCLRNLSIRKHFKSARDECCKECSKDRTKRMNEIAAKNAEAIDRLSLVALGKFRDDVAAKLMRQQEYGIDTKTLDVPHASEVIQNILAAIGGTEMLALHVGANLLATAPGSAQRTQMVSLIAKETRKITELDLQERALSELEDGELNDRLAQLMQRILVKEATSVPLAITDAGAMGSEATGAEIEFDLERELQEAELVEA